jgi:hypothetical protein
MGNYVCSVRNGQWFRITSESRSSSGPLAAGGPLAGPAAGGAEMCMRRRVAPAVRARPSVPVGLTAVPLRMAPCSSAAVRSRPAGPVGSRGRRCLTEHAARCLSCGVADGVVHQAGPSGTARAPNKLKPTFLAEVDLATCFPFQPSTPPLDPCSPSSIRQAGAWQASANILGPRARRGGSPRRSAPRPHYPSTIPEVATCGHAVVHSRRANGRRYAQPLAPIVPAPPISARRLFVQDLWAQCRVREARTPAGNTTCSPLRNIEGESQFSRRRQNPDAFQQWLSLKRCQPWLFSRFQAWSPKKKQTEAVVEKRA